MKNIFSVKKLFSNQTHKGAALIIAMLVITAVSGISFYASRLAIKELIVMSRQEDSLNAYYLAETGVEEGLLLWRYDHDVELSNKCQSAGNCQEPPDESNRSGPVEVKISDNQSYKLKIWHRNMINTPETATIGKDESYEYDVSELSSLRITCNSGCDADMTDRYRNALEFFIVDSFNNVSDKGMLCQGACEDTVTRLANMTNAKTLRLRAWSTPKSFTITSSNGRLDSRYTTIESTGIFGSTQRKLQIKIDRQSGRTLGIFDFMLFGGSSTGIVIHD